MGLFLSSVAWAALAGLQGDSEAEGPVIGPPAPAECRLGELRASPSRQIGQRVQFAVQVASVGEPWTPYPTRFGAANWTRVAGWCDGQNLWEREAYLDAAPYLFVARGSITEWRLQRARPHERWWVTARVSQVFAGEPWIEIESAERLPQHVGEGSVLHASRAFDLWERGQRALALAEIERAMAGPLPAAAAATLEAQWQRWSERFRTEPQPASVRPVPTVESIYHLKLGPENLPPRRVSKPVPLPASAPRDRE